MGHRTSSCHLPLSKMLVKTDGERGDKVFTVECLLLPSLKSIMHVPTAHKDLETKTNGSEWKL